MCCLIWDFCGINLSRLCLLFLKAKEAKSSYHTYCFMCIKQALLTHISINLGQMVTVVLDSPVGQVNHSHLLYINRWSHWMATPRPHPTGSLINVQGVYYGRYSSFMTLPQHCYNVDNDIISMFTQQSGNVVWMLYKCWCHVEIRPNYNIQTMLFFFLYIIFNIATMLWQHCPNIVWILWADQSTNVHTMLYQHWEITSFSTLSQCCYNIGGTHQESEILISHFKNKI